VTLDGLNRNEWWKQFGTPDSVDTPPAPDVVSHEAHWRHGTVQVARVGDKVVITVLMEQDLHEPKYGTLVQAKGSPVHFVTADLEDAIQIANIIAAAARWTPDR